MRFLSLSGDLKTQSEEYVLLTSTVKKVILHRILVVARNRLNHCC